MAKLELVDMTFAYDTDKGPEIILDHLNLKIEQGEFVCVIGRSGCGKTTLLTLLAGLLLPSQGAILLDGLPIEGPSTNRAIVFQHYSLFPWMTAKKNVSFAVRQANKSLSKEQASEIADQFLAKVGMTHAAHKYPFQLSGGMSQRIAIAKALAMDAEILLLDEPFGALDALNRQELQILLSDLWLADKPQKTVVFVTHDIDEALLLADRIVFMRPGKIEREFYIPFGQPSYKEQIIYSAEYRDLKQQLLDLFNPHPELSDNVQN